MQHVSSSSSFRSISARYGKYGAQVAQQLSWTLHAFGVGAREGLRLLARYHALSRLSDDALAKRGLARGDIARAVLDECKNAPVVAA